MAQVSLILEAFAEPRRPFPIEKDGYYAITKRADDVSIDIDRCTGWGDLGHPACLALVAINGTHIMLRSASESCAVIPPNVEDHKKIALEQSTPDCQYSVILRPDDRIVLWSKAPRAPRDCTLKVQVDNVQVESSLGGGTSQSERRSQHQNIGTSEKRAPAATPLAASTTSQVVSETPATERRQQGRGNGCSLDGNVLDGNVSTMDDLVNIHGDHEADGDMEHHRKNAHKEHEDNDDLMYDRTNAPRSSARRASTMTDHMDAPEDHDEENDTTASESENEDEPNEEQSPNHPFKSQRVLSPRVEIPAARGCKRAAQEDSPRATKKRATGVGALKESTSDTPPSSNRSRRSAVNDQDEKDVNKSLRVAFSNSTVNTRPYTVRFLSSNGVRIQDSVTNGCDYLCVNASGHLIKSFKLLMSVILGKTIISDEWVLKSIDAKTLVDPDDFITTNAPSEWQWGKSKEEVVKALGRDRSRLFDGVDILVTPKLKKEYGEAYKDIEKLLKKSGAATVVSKQMRAQDPSSTKVVIGSENDDADVIKLTDSDDRWSCFGKELISMSILRGRLDLESNEFKLQRTKSGKKKTGRPKKSK